MFCTKCGSQLNEGSAFCSRCGARVGPVVEEVAADVSPKSRLATSLLAIFLGRFGVHRFYVGKIATAVVMLIIGVISLICLFVAWIGPLAAGDEDPAWGLLAIGYVLSFAVGIWTLVDFIIAVTGNFKDSQGKLIKKW